jgi:hypothetical protein
MRLRGISGERKNSSSMPNVQPNDVASLIGTYARLRPKNG